jgi:hypothetical protein
MIDGGMERKFTKSREASPISHAVISQARSGGDIGSISSMSIVSGVESTANNTPTANAKTKVIALAM